MFFRQVLYRDLGCASYIVGDAGEAVVVDPRWDIDVYLETAAAERFEIAHVIDTHEHADHVSGRPALVPATGAKGHRPASGEGDEPDRIRAETSPGGSLLLRAVGPGHRPEHLASWSATARAGTIWLLLTGDSLLVGDVPARISPTSPPRARGTARELARAARPR